MKAPYIGQPVVYFQSEVEGRNEFAALITRIEDPHRAIEHERCGYVDLMVFPPYPGLPHPVGAVPPEANGIGPVGHWRPAGWQFAPARSTD